MGDKRLIYSIYSGTVYEIPKEDFWNLDAGQVPLLSKPKGNCKHCFGRGYEYHEKIRNEYQICRCLVSKVDWPALKEKNTKYLEATPGSNVTYKNETK